jgi:hypothetical protein
LGDNSTTAQANYKTLQNAFAPQPLGYYPDPTGLTPASQQLKLFQFRLTGNTGDMQMYGRSRGLVTPITPDFAYGYIQTRIMMSFPDPRYYTDAGTTVSGSTISLTNAGWATSCPVITDTSPSASGQISDGTVNMIFLGVPTAGPLIIDLLSRVIYTNGYANRNVMTGTSNGYLSIDANSTASWTSTIGSMSTTYRSAFI